MRRKGGNQLATAELPSQLEPGTKYSVLQLTHQPLEPQNSMPALLKILYAPFSREASIYGHKDVDTNIEPWNNKEHSYTQYKGALNLALNCK